MATKNQVRIEFNEELILGTAEFEDKQLENLQYASNVRLRSDYTYVIRRQWVHNEKLLKPVNGNDKSKKLFIIGINKATNAVETVLTLSLNSLLQQFYDIVRDNPGMRISAVKNDQQLWRAISGTTQVSVWKKGNLPTRSEKKKVYIPYDIAFELAERTAVYTGKMIKKSGGWDMLTKVIDGNTYLDLGVQNMNLFTEVEVPDFNDESIGERALTQLRKYQEELPE